MKRVGLIMPHNFVQSGGPLLEATLSKFKPEDVVLILADPATSLTFAYHTFTKRGFQCVEFRWGDMWRSEVFWPRVKAYCTLVQCSLAFWDGENKAFRHILSALKQVQHPLHITYTVELLNLVYADGNPNL